MGQQSRETHNPPQSEMPLLEQQFNATPNGLILPSEIDLKTMLVGNFLSKLYNINYDQVRNPVYTAQQISQNSPSPDFNEARLVRTINGARYILEHIPIEKDASNYLLANLQGEKRRLIEALNSLIKQHKYVIIMKSPPHEWTVKTNIKRADVIFQEARPNLKASSKHRVSRKTRQPSTLPTREKKHKDLPPIIKALLQLPATTQEIYLAALPIHWRLILEEGYNLRQKHGDTQVVRNTKDIVGAMSKIVTKNIYQYRHFALKRLREMMEIQACVPKDIQQFLALPQEQQTAYLKALPMRWRKDFVAGYNLDGKYGDIPFEQDLSLLKKRFKKRATLYSLEKNIREARKALRTMMTLGEPINIPRPKIIHKPHKLKPIIYQTERGIDLTQLTEEALKPLLSWIEPRQKEIFFKAIGGASLHELALEYETNVSNIKWTIHQAMYRIDHPSEERAARIDSTPYNVLGRPIGKITPEERENIYHELKFTPTQIRVVELRLGIEDEVKHKLMEIKRMVGLYSDTNVSAVLRVVRKKLRTLG